MKFTATETVRGFLDHIYNIDGNSADSRYLFIDVALDPDHGGRGMRTEGYKVESSQVFDVIRAFPLPVRCELELEAKASRGKSTMVVMSIKPLERPVQAKAA